jgi:hypothetical protein
MAFQNVGHILIPPRSNIDGGSTSMLLDASGEKAAFIFRAPKTGNISNVYFRLGAVTTGQTLKASLQDVSLANGDPDEVVDESGTVSVADTDDNLWKQVTFGASRAVTRGDLLCCVVEFDSTVGNLNLIRHNVSNVQGYAYATLKTGTWTKANTGYYLAVGYDDGTYPQIPGTAPHHISLQNFANNSTPDEVGNKIIARVPMRVIGAYFAGRNTGDFQFVLYEGSSVTPTAVLTSATMDADVDNGLADTYFFTYFDSSYDLTVGETYRLVLLPTTTTSLGRLDLNYTAASILSGDDFGTDIVRTSRTNGGNFAEDTDKRVLCGLLVSHIDDGAGGESFTGSVINRGIN